MIRPLSQCRGGSWCLREFNCHFIWGHVVISSQKWQLINQSINHTISPDAAQFPYSNAERAQIKLLLPVRGEWLWYVVVDTTREGKHGQGRIRATFKQEAKGHRCHQSGTVEKQLMWPADQLVGGQPSSSLTWKAVNSCLDLHSCDVLCRQPEWWSRQLTDNTDSFFFYSTFPLTDALLKLYPVQTCLYSLHSGQLNTWRKCENGDAVSSWGRSGVLIVYIFVDKLRITHWDSLYSK